MSEICIDNRFDVMKKAKEHLIESTNIECCPEDMKIVDSILFRCWQMGWLDIYDDSKNIPNIKQLNQKLYNCYRTHALNDEDAEWNQAIYRALRIVNGEE